MSLPTHAIHPASVQTRTRHQAASREHAAQRPRSSSTQAAEHHRHESPSQTYLQIPAEGLHALHTSTDTNRSHVAVPSPHPAVLLEAAAVSESPSARCPCTPRIRRSAHLPTPADRYSCPQDKTV